ncbi:hypothetical protein R6Y95_08625 [Methanoculleus palmolei]|uniref:Uncharacterized protein n=1 Tax=Methanoculleus palmolei TaxID=72612 RepID=A0ABD8A7M7_9EURY|nr:hypothetical protein R6Y95_08625 [Methanoculleus palmolei]
MTQVAGILGHSLEHSSNHLLEGTPEFFPIDPGLFEDANQGIFLQLTVQRYGKDPPFLLHNNMG